MPEQDRERLSGETVEERDARDLAEVRADLDEHKLIRLGLPSPPIVRDAEVIPPISAVGGQETDAVQKSTFDQVSEKVTPIHVHIRYVRDVLLVAQGMDDTEACQEIKRKAA